MGNIASSTLPPPGGGSVKTSTDYADARYKSIIDIELLAAGTYYVTGGIGNSMTGNPIAEVVENKVYSKGDKFRVLRFGIGWGDSGIGTNAFIIKYKK